jgi:hypothetical protein
MNNTTATDTAFFPLGDGHAVNLTQLAGKLFTNTSLAYRLWHRLDLANLRHIFYLISPYETTVARLEDVPNYNIQVGEKFQKKFFCGQCSTIPIILG